MVSPTHSCACVHYQRHSVKDAQSNEHLIDPAKHRFGVRQMAARNSVGETHWFEKVFNAGSELGSERDSILPIPISVQKQALLSTRSCEKNSSSRGYPHGVMALAAFSRAHRPILLLVVGSAPRGRSASPHLGHAYLFHVTSFIVRADGL